ncbi:hypothetical protein ACIQZG_01800 [Lysinibacillus sp. NPDC096418]|uniref:hypothetical protein n=1 Tax=Lysinibacillus sp. NPDC096418 TaxID=3364138 RepID=UPI00380BDE1D
MIRKQGKRGEAAAKNGIANEKVYILVVRHRWNYIISVVVIYGRINSTISNRGPIKNTVKKWLFPCRKTICTEGIFLIQNVFVFHLRIKTFFSPFRGIVTKYANYYLARHRFIDERLAP